MKALKAMIAQHPAFSWSDDTKQITPRADYPGHLVTRGFVQDCDRYRFDRMLCMRTEAPQWRQYDTSQDAWYFGIWISVEHRAIFCYAEGDLTLTEFPTLEDLRAELARLEQVYGHPPPAWIVYDLDARPVTRTEVFSPRPEVPQ